MTHTSVCLIIFLGESVCVICTIKPCYWDIVPHLFQSNRIILTIVDIVDPMLCTVEVAEVLGVLECLPLVPIDEAPHWMILNFLEDTVRQHYLCDVVCTSGAVHEEL